MTTPTPTPAQLQAQIAAMRADLQLLCDTLASVRHVQTVGDMTRLLRVLHTVEARQGIKAVQR